MIRRLWTEERVSQKGKYWMLDDVRLMPRVVQKPHPPVWIAAIGSEESFLYAAKNGFMRAAWTEVPRSGRDAIKRSARTAAKLLEGAHPQAEDALRALGAR